MENARYRDCAEDLLNAFDGATTVGLLSATDPGFGLEDAYAVSGELLRARMARGERPAGWKIGFTNRTIWDEYDVHAPIWGPIYDTSVREVAAGEPVRLDVSRFCQPRIEPEICFRMARQPAPGMSEPELLACVDAVGHGVEIVQSVFADWRFQAADTAAAFALHALYRHGPLAPLAAKPRDEWLRVLSGFSVTLFRDGVEIDRGVARNVLDGPLSALKHFVDAFDPAPFGRGIEAGDIVTTGTVTRAWPVEPGETWSTRLEGIDLPGLSLAL